MAGYISRDRKGNVVWEDVAGRFTFEPQGHGRGQTVAREDLVDMEGSLDIGGLDASLDAIVLEVNAWLATH
jgi:hypothetical protein